MESNVLSKAQLKKEIKRFLLDKNRGISIQLFSEIAGLSSKILVLVFLKETVELTEYVQIRVNKAYNDWKQGKIKVMRRHDNSRYVDYRNKPIPPLAPSMNLKLTRDGIKIHVGVVNHHDYSKEDLQESLENSYARFK